MVGFSSLTGNVIVLCLQLELNHCFNNPQLLPHHLQTKWSRLGQDGIEFCGQVITTRLPLLSPP